MVWLDPNDLYPNEITVCAEEPPVPPRPAPGLPREDEVKAGYTRDLRTAWADCYDTVKVTKERKAGYQQQYDNARASPIGRFWRDLTGKNKPLP